MTHAGCPAERKGEPPLAEHRELVESLPARLQELIASELITVEEAGDWVRNASDALTRRERRTTRRRP